MRVPLSWLRDFAPFEGDPADLATTLDELGLVVEEVVRVGEHLEDVVLARVLEIAPIPGADKIRRVVVEAGAGPVEVVCGAWNFAPGDVVPFAPVGAVLPGDFAISRRTMRGVVSNGMLCSGRELGLSDDHEGILVVADGAGPGVEGVEPGRPLVEALAVGPDVVFDIAVEANRPDAWCVAGVARDLAAALRLPFAIPEPTVAADPALGTAAAASVTVVDDDLCPRFTARLLADVVVGSSPAWMARRLTLAGMRPINSVVDASNYVMLELGQPTHPYDLDRLGGGGLRVRAARRGETLVTLDGVERAFGTRSVGIGDDRRDCLICDAEDVPVGIGGIMGGAASEITPATGRVLLEAAYFTPMAIARTSKRLGLRSEASARFERGCDPEGIDRAVARLGQLLGAGAVVAGTGIDVRGPVPGPARVRVRVARVNAVLGTDLDDAVVASLLHPIGFATTDPEPGVLEVTVPTFRPDTEREIDVVEEVARHLGYGRLPRRRPFAPQVGALTPYQRARRRVRDMVAGLGAHEAWTPSLLGPDDHGRVGLGPGVRVANPLGPDESELRRTLLPGMVRALAFNADRRQPALRLFEVGHVFPPPDAGRVARAMAHDGATVIDEREMLGVALAAEGDDARTAAAAWTLVADALGIEGVELEAAPWPGLHPTRAAELRVGGDGPGLRLGVVGEVDPGALEAFGLDAGRRVGWLEIDLGILLTETPRRSPLVRPVSRFPSADIDLAFVVDEGVPAGAVAATLRRAGGEVLESVELFDVYRGPGTPAGTRSLAYHLRLCSLDHTLTDEEVAG
ncbi:MAG TPA: phenylalanine--tRNA ligase subunit beta, partial [Acidimicrobiales bacterium]|nr:phenylalanine--tRNA ligase subunit beta [Acidimicrobiales bacterium]